MVPKPVINLTRLPESICWHVSSESCIIEGKLLLTIRFMNLINILLQANYYNNQLDNKKNNAMNNTTRNKHKSNKTKTTHKHKTKTKTKTTNEPVWHWMQYADIMFEFSLLPVVLLLAFSSISRILLILVIPVSIFLGVLQSAIIINAGNKNDKIICFISTSIIYALMLSNVKLGLPVIVLFILSIIIGWIVTYIAYIISMKRKNSARNNADTVNTTAVNAGMSDNAYYTV